MPNPRRRPLAHLRATAFGAAGIVALTLSGCVGTPAPTPPPSSSAAAAPIFASDEEALAADTDAYRTYSDASAAIVADGGLGPERIAPTVSSDYSEQLKAEFLAIQSAGLRMVGDTLIENERLGESAYSADGAHITIYFCRDVSSVHVYDVYGSDVTPQGREDRTPTQAFLVSSDEDPGILVVDGVERWRGENLC